MSSAHSQDAFRPKIKPVIGGEARPLWSVMIPTYNCDLLLRRALSSVLEQALPPADMQIEVVDDCSTEGDVEAVVRELGKGRVSFHRQPGNVGHTRNFNSCLQRSRGHLIHLLHGDDFVLDGFYRTMQVPFSANVGLGAAFCRNSYVDQNGQTSGLAELVQDVSGVIPNWLEKIAVEQRLQPPAVVVRREVYEQLGGFDQRILSYGEDWEMWVRIASSYPVWYEPQPLAAYRLHGANLSTRAMRSGQNLRDFRTAIALNRSLLPPDRAEIITNSAKRATALSAVRKGHRLLSASQDTHTALVQLKEVIITSPTPYVAMRALLLLGHIMATTAKRLIRTPTGHK